jgi:hypothetical protein
MPENDVEKMTFGERANRLNISPGKFMEATGFSWGQWGNSYLLEHQDTVVAYAARDKLHAYFKGRESEAALHEAESKNDDGWPKSEPEKPRDMTERRVALGLSLSQVTEIIHSRPEEATYDSQFAALYNLLESWQAKIDRLSWRITELLTSSKKSEDRLRRLLADISEASQ